MHKFKHGSASQITLSELMLPSHSNFSGKIHGGHILNLMDQVAFACASKHSGHYCVTASVNRVNFLHPVEIGELLTLKAAINYTGRTSMVVGVRVESENIKTGIVHHCNSSYFTMVAKADDGSNTKVPGLIVTDTQGIRRYMRSVKRIADSHQRATNFDETNFDPSDYLDELQEKNVKVELG